MNTPRTDAAMKIMGNYRMGYEMVTAEFAKVLEREADTLKAENLKLRELLQDMLDLHMSDDAEHNFDLHKRVRTALGSKT